MHKFRCAYFVHAILMEFSAFIASEVAFNGHLQILSLGNIITQNFRRHATVSLENAIFFQSTRFQTENFAFQLQ